MAIKLSTGMRDDLLDTGSFRSILNLGFIKIYTGAEPASPNDAATGTLLCTISNNSTVTGLTFAATASGGVISKNGSETWSGVNAATGTAGYFRFVAVGDTGASSTTQQRLQGSVAVVGGDLNLSNTTLSSGATQTIDYFSATLPIQ